jgi:hypothetical protein
MECLRRSDLQYAFPSGLLMKHISISNFRKTSDLEKNRMVFKRCVPVEVFSPRGGHALFWNTVDKIGI